MDKPPNKRSHIKRRNPEQIRNILMQYESSDLNSKEIAREIGISLATYWIWKRKCKNSKTSKPHWIEVNQSSSRIEPQAMAQIHLPGKIRVDLFPDFEIDSIATLIERLGQQP